MKKEFSLNAFIASIAYGAVNVIIGTFGFFELNLNQNFILGAMYVAAVAIVTYLECKTIYGEHRYLVEIKQDKQNKHKRVKA